MKQTCSVMTLKGSPCSIPADRCRDGAWFCHLHDPLGRYQRRHDADSVKRKCAAKTKGGASCPINAERSHKGTWYCHVHDPEGANQKAIAARRNVVPSVQKRKDRKREERVLMSPEELVSLIPYPSQASEFEVQTFLYSQLRKMGLDVRGEVTTRCGTDRFDLVVYDPDCPNRSTSRRGSHAPLCIIEVKKSKLSTKGINRKPMRSQLKRYAAYGLPIYLVTGMREARKLVEHFRNWQVKYELPRVLRWK